MSALRIADRHGVRLIDLGPQPAVRLTGRPPEPVHGTLGFGHSAQYDARAEYQKEYHRARRAAAREQAA